MDLVTLLWEYFIWSPTVVTWLMQRATQCPFGFRVPLLAKWLEHLLPIPLWLWWRKDYLPHGLEEFFIFSESAKACIRPQSAYIGSLITHQCSVNFLWLILPLTSLCLHSKFLLMIFSTPSLAWIFQIVMDLMECLLLSLETASVLSPSLVKLCHLCLLAIFPFCWKYAHIQPA